MNKRWAWILVLIAVAAGATLYWWAREPPIGDYRDPATVAQGQALYATHCAQCHGESGRGENPAEPMGGTKPDGGYLAPALDGTGHAWHHAPELLFRVIKEGSPAQDSTMRGWAGRMRDEEIGAVIAYFRSLWPPEIQARYSQMHAH